MIRPTLVLLMLIGAVFMAPTAASAQSSLPECDVDEQQKRIQYSLYFENYRAESYEAALPHLEWIIECAPGFGGQTPDDRNLRRGVEVYEALAERTDDAAERQEYLDRAMHILDTGVSTLQDEGVEVDPYYWNLMKGRFLQTHEQAFAQRQGEVCDLYHDAYEMRPEEIDDFYLQVIAFCRAEEAIADDDPAMRRDVRAFLEGDLIAVAETPAAQEYIKGQAERLITTPREQFAFLYERYQAEGMGGLSDDELEELFRLNQQAGAQLLASEEEVRNLRRELLPRIAELRPTYGLLSSLASAALADEDYQQAETFYNQALELAEEPNQRRDAYYNIAVIKQQQGQLAAAANHAREALSIDGNHAPSLFMMGSLIQSSIRGGDVDSRAAYWCAADFFNRAASAGYGPARQAAASALGAAPKSDEYFFKGWRPGQTVTASYGWGSCQARVR